MISNIRQLLARIFAGFVLLTFVAVAVIAQDSYDKTIEKWRAEREAKLIADDGWLTVTGLFWLREGQNEFGSAPTNDIVLPPGSAPDKIGSVEWLNGNITLRVAEGVTVTANGKPVRELVLHSDTVKRPEVIEAGDLSFLLLKRGNRWGIRLKDKHSSARQNFTGLRWYPAKESFRIAAEFIAYDQPKEISIVNVLGDIENYKSPGLLKFKLSGQEYTLEPVNSGEDQLFIIFRDLTSNKTTYAASRFLYADRPKNGKVILDFNQAINPPCAFTAYATCPLPPKQNRLNAAIEAGELTYHSEKQITAQVR